MSKRSRILVVSAAITLPLIMTVFFGVCKQERLFDNSGELNTPTLISYHELGQRGRSQLESELTQYPLADLDLNNTFYGNENSEDVMVYYVLDSHELRYCGLAPVNSVIAGKCGVPIDRNTLSIGDNLVTSVYAIPLPKPWKVRTVSFSDAGEVVFEFIEDLVLFTATCDNPALIGHPKLWRIQEIRSI